MSEEQVVMEESLPIEERAAAMGWVPKEQFKGDPERWLPADKFVRRAEEELPILRSTLSRLEGKLASQSREMKQLQEALEHLVEMNRLAEERAFQKAVEELRQKQKQAVNERDMEAFEEAQKQYEELVKRHPAVKKQELPKSESDGWFRQDIFEKWLENNQWYLEEPDMAEYAEAMDRRLAVAKPYLSHEERLEEITRLVHKKFQRQRPQVSPVEDHTVQRPKMKKGLTVKDLPEDVQEVYRVLSKQTKPDGSPLVTEEEYVDMYMKAYGGGLTNVHKKEF